MVSEAAEETAVLDQQRQAAIQTESPTEMSDEPLMQVPPEVIDFAPRQRGYYILVEKSERKMTMFVSGRQYRTYDIYLGFTPDGHKTRRGDGRTPEGEYYVCKRNTKSAYYRSLLVSYPSPGDARRGVASGLVRGSVLSAVRSAYQRGVSPPQNTRLGGSICIHGEGSRCRQREDWTAGCIAVTNKEMAEIFSLIPLGTPVTILP